MSTPNRIRILLLALLLVPALPARAEFSDVASAWGFFGGQPTWGAQIVDMDGDGDLDVLNAHHFYSGFVFANDGTGHLSVWGLPQLLQSTADRHGYLWADLDNDGVTDVACSHGSDGGCGTCSDDGHELWKGDGDGTFTAVPDAGGMYDQLGRGRAFSAADLDGDGDLEVFHGKAPSVSSPNSLYRNDGGMTFTDVAAAWGVDEVLGTVGGLFADVDDDGDPDLWVGGDEFERPTTLFRHDGDHYTDVTASAFDVAPPILAGADFGDFDDDGDLDLLAVEGSEAVYDVWSVTGNVFRFFSHFRFGEDGTDRFALDAAGGNPTASFHYLGGLHPEFFFLGPSGVHPSASSFALTDAYVGAPSFTPGVDVGLYCWRESPGGRWIVETSGPPGSYGNFDGTITTVSGVVDPAGTGLETLVTVPAPPHLYRNDGGTFVDLTAAEGFPSFLNARHATWVDFDSDGDLDAHIVVRGTLESGNPPDALLRNDGGTFALLSGPGWLPGQTAYLADGAVWGDLDGDGDPDAILQDGSGPLSFTLACPAQLFRNDGPTGAWLAVDLVARPGEGTAVGAKVDVYHDGVRRHRRVSANSWRGFQPAPRVLVGLGEAMLVDSVVVRWPEGVVQTFGPYAANQRVTLRRDDPTAVSPGASLGGPFAGAITPQPARGLQRVRLSLPTNRRVHVRVVAVTGRVVRDLGTVRGQGAASVDVTWDGRDDGGEPVPAGIYFVRGEGDLRFTRKAVRLR